MPSIIINKILAVLYCLNGGIYAFMIIVTGVILAVTEEEPLLHLRPQKQLIAVIMLIALFLSLVYLVTGFGLWKRRPWAKTSALVLGVMFAWYIPVGLGLGLYAWLFLRSEDGKRLYSKAE
jgi:hypothetical protein